VTFAAGSAGVGKSVLVANLAASLAGQGREVLVVDENTDHTIAAFYGAFAVTICSRSSIGKNALGSAPCGGAGNPFCRRPVVVKQLGQAERCRATHPARLPGGDRPLPDVVLVDASLIIRSVSRRSVLPRTIR
jgi:flagellar biosynthesis protein FlhG